MISFFTAHFRKAFFLLKSLPKSSVTQFGFTRCKLKKNPDSDWLNSGPSIKGVQCLQCCICITVSVLVVVSFVCVNPSVAADFYYFFPTLQRSRNPPHHLKPITPDMFHLKLVLSDSLSSVGTCFFSLTLISVLSIPVVDYGSSHSFTNR